MHSVADIKGYTGSVSIYDNGVAIKKYNRRDVWNREIKWLTLLERFDRVPAILEIRYEDISVAMTYCGERISKENIPGDWKQQTDYILEGLKKHGCAHNDIKPTDILVEDDTIYLVDFGWATKIGDPIPKRFPRCLGGPFRKGVHKFDDRFSMEKSINHVLSKE